MNIDSSIKKVYSYPKNNKLRKNSSNLLVLLLAYIYSQNKNSSFLISFGLHLLVFYILSQTYIISKNNNLNLAINTSAAPYININFAENISKPNKEKITIKKNHIVSNYNLQESSKNKENNNKSKLNKQNITTGGKDQEITTAKTIIRDQNLINYKAPIYPQEAINKNQEGNVIVRFLLSPATEIKDIIIAKSSGIKSLDNAVLNTVPFWNLKRDIQNDTWIEVTVNFTLQ